MITEYECNTLMNYILYLEYIKMGFFYIYIYFTSYHLLLWEILNIYILFCKMNTVFWNETLHFSLLFFVLSLFVCVFFIPEVWACRFFGSVWQSKYTQPETADIQVWLPSCCHFLLGVTFPIGAIVSYLFAVALTSLWVSKGAVHSSS